ncbi:hypothetical protein [Nodosilinea nodulosa]|uniref:hypothetical protein n=1 Tax=Nodosilinea nodulosa TaxID=416001 RepID=UPI000364D747|nr:hypothetical protein [Nodosilinea nodulosa]
MLSDEQRAKLEEGITQNARHIFRQAPGHFSEDTPATRQLIIETALNPLFYQGQDKYKTQWYSQTLDTGSQVWVQVRNGKIRNAGINLTARPWRLDTGFAGLS